MDSGTLRCVSFMLEVFVRAKKGRDNRGVNVQRLFGDTGRNKRGHASTNMVYLTVDVSGTGTWKR
jgi:hypothetical protein